MKLQKILALATVLTMLPMAVSCMSDEDDEIKNEKQLSSAEHTDYAVVQAAENSEIGFYWFVNDNGTLWYPYREQMITSYSVTDEDGNDKSGNRVIVYYDDLNDFTPIPGYEKGITLLGVQDVLSKDIATAKNASELIKFGSSPIHIDYAHLANNGKWIDLRVSVNTYAGAGHNISLVNNLVADTASINLDGYTYLELHHYTVMSSTEATSNVTSYISYRIPDDLNPYLLKTKGIAIAYDNMFGGRTLLKVDWTGTSQTTI